MFFCTPRIYFWKAYGEEANANSFPNYRKAGTLKDKRLIWGQYTATSILQKQGDCVSLKPIETQSMCLYI